MFWYVLVIKLIKILSIYWDSFLLSFLFFWDRVVVTACFLSCSLIILQTDYQGKVEHFGVSHCDVWRHTQSSSLWTSIITRTITSPSHQENRTNYLFENEKWAPALINKSWSSFGVKRAQRSSSYHFYWQNPKSSRETEKKCKWRLQS